MALCWSSATCSRQQFSASTQRVDWVAGAFTPFQRVSFSISITPQHGYPLESDAFLHVDVDDGARSPRRLVWTSARAPYGDFLKAWEILKLFYSLWWLQPHPWKKNLKTGHTLRLRMEQWPSTPTPRRRPPSAATSIFFGSAWCYRYLRSKAQLLRYPAGALAPCHVDGHVDKVKVLKFWVKRCTLSH